jgi:chromosome segregation ATPase
LEIELYNAQYQIATKVHNHYQQAQQTISKMKTDIYQFMYNQRTLEEQFTLHRKNYKEATTKLEILVKETHRDEQSLAKIQAQSHQLQAEVLKLEEDHYQQSQRYDIEQQRLEQKIILVEQNCKINQQKETQIISLHSEATSLQLRLDDMNSQLHELRTSDEADRLAAREGELRDVRFKLDYSINKHQTNLDSLDQTLHHRELQHASLLQSIGPETRNEMLQLQADAVALQGEIDQFQKMVELSTAKVEGLEAVLPQMTQELELARFDLGQKSAQYDSLISIIASKTTTLASNQTTIDGLEQQIADTKVKRCHEEQRLREVNETALAALRLDRERLVEAMSTMRTTHQTALYKMEQDMERECMDLAQKIALLENSNQTKQSSLNLLLADLEMSNAERQSLQVTANEHAKVFSMTGPELERSITKIIAEQAKKRNRIRLLEKENSAYDDENLIIRRNKLQKVREANGAIANQIVQLGGSGLLDKIVKPVETPRWDQIAVESIPEEYLQNIDYSHDYLGSSDRSSNNTRDTIYEDDECQDGDEEERSATCGGDENDQDVGGGRASGPQRRSKQQQDLTETQSLLSLRSTGNATRQPIKTGVGLGKPSTRLSALPTSTSSNQLPKPTATGTRPLARATNINVATGSGVGTRTMAPGVTKVGSGVGSKAGLNSNVVGKTAPSKTESELPSYMRSTLASERRNR